MNSQVLSGINELRLQFQDSELTVRDDGSGGAYLLIEPILLGERFSPLRTWMGFQIPALYPYADIYPVFIGGGVKRVDMVPFAAPVTEGHTFEGRPAIQISRRTTTVVAGNSQKATTKALKILDFLEKLP